MKVKSVCLTEVAGIEPRPIKNKTYPIGTIIIQISATKGQILFLRSESQIEEKYAVISPKENIHPFYLFSVIEKFFPSFFVRYKQGLNFKAEDLNAFYFPIHQEKADRDTVGKMMMCFGAERQAFYVYNQLKFEEKND